MKSFRSDVWCGANYEAAENGILVLGESWYGEEPSPLPVNLEPYIRRWVSATKEGRDYTFSRIFNSSSARRAYQAKPDERLRFWDSIAFYNFVPGTLGYERSNRPKKQDFENAVYVFEYVLDELSPKGVWILGKEQVEHSMPSVCTRGIEFEKIQHPASRGLSREDLRISWAKLAVKVAILRLRAP